MQLHPRELPGTHTRPLTIAIGKGRGFMESLSFVKIPDSPSMHSFRKGEVPVYHDVTANITLVTVRSRDMSWMLEQGHIDVAIGSSVWFREYHFAALDCLLQLPLQSCRLSLIAPRLIPPSQIKTICTKFDAITQQYMTANNIPARIIHMEGAHEAALSLHMADAIADVIETGRTIKRMGFRELDCITPLSHEIWTRKADIISREKLLSRLQLAVY